MKCPSQKSITIGQNVCPSLRGAIGSISFGQIASLEARNQIWASHSTDDSVLVISTVSNLVVGVAHLGSGLAGGLAYVPPQKGFIGTSTIDPFTIPPVGNNVMVHVVDTALLAPNKFVFFDGPATFRVISVQDVTHATLQFQNFNGDLPPGSVIGGLVNLYRTAPRTDLLYAVTSFPANFVSIDPDSLAVTNLPGIAGNGANVFFASVSNCVCFGGSKLYSYSITSGFLTQVTTSIGGGAFYGYSAAHDLLYGTPSNDPPHATGFPTGYNPATLAINGFAMVTSGNNYRSNCVYCPNNDQIYFPNEVALFPETVWVDVFSASSYAKLASIVVDGRIDPMAPIPHVDSSSFALNSALVIATLRGRIVVIDTGSNSILCYVGSTNATYENRGSCYNAATGRVYVANSNFTTPPPVESGTIDYYA